MISKIKTFALCLFLSLIFVSPINAQAKKSTPSPTPSKALLPQMVAEENVIINSPVNSDLFVAGSKISLEATASGNVYVAGGEVDIKNTINEDLIVAGGVVNISGTIGKNLIIAGGQVNIDPSANIGGYVLGGANQAKISGKINGPVRFGANNFNLTNTASVNGDLEVYSKENSIDSAAKVTGEKRVTKIETPENQTGLNFRDLSQKAFSALSFFAFISQLLVLFLIIRIFGEKLVPAISEALAHPFSYLGHGLIALVIIPILVILLLVTVVGVPLAIIITVIYLLSTYLATLLSAVFIGNWLFNKKWINSTNLYLQSFIGYFILFIIGFIPFLGPVVKFLAFLLGLGIIFQWQRSLLSAAKTK
jgi:hypothetical protein